MTRMLHTRPHGSALTKAMTLIELMIAVALMSIIIIGLYTMFDRTQAVMRSGVVQVDVQESARAATGIISSDLEQLAVTDIPGVYNFFVSTNPILASPLNFQLLNGQTKLGELQGFYFFAHDTQWKFIGYRVDYSGTNFLDAALLTNGVGTLKRYEFDYPPLSISSNWVQSNLTAFTTYSPVTVPSTNEAFNRVLDGVVHFQVHALDAGGYYLTNSEYWYTNRVAPAAVDIEIGVLEPQAVGRVRLTQNPNLLRAYLTNQTARIHMYRIRAKVYSVAP